MPSEPLQLADAFSQAAELNEEKCRAFLERLGAETPSLRRDVEKLLRAQSKAERFLERPAVVVPDPAIAMQSMSESVGTQIGPYKLREQIGEGGFGLVFVAEQQQPVARKVALKIIKPGMDTKEVIARFESERQALALMDHPNVARVLDAGATDSGRPYFVMELVRGIPITEFCDQRQLNSRERLELFVDVCRAVQHAHQKGIIHRDLKPTNILVTLHDDQPVVKVIDFGVAKALSQKLTDKTVYTAYGQMVGTPLYMSPEQTQLSGLDVDTRSDVYSLGVVLYELLTRTTPFDKQSLSNATFDELRRIIREDEPPKPSARVSTLNANTLSTLSQNRRLASRRLQNVLRGELDWIVMKALDKQRSRRYESASAFAGDIERYLNDEPVLACPPSLGYRFRKFARRNRIALTAGISIVAVLFMTIALLATSNYLINEQKHEADAQKDYAEREQQRAERAKSEAKRRLFDARFSEARAGRWSRRPGQRFAGLKALKEAAALARELNLSEQQQLKLRNEVIAALALPDVRLQKEWEGYPAGSTAGLAFDRDLQHYARSDLQGNISVRRIEDDREVALLPGIKRGGLHTGAAYIRFSPDGRLLAVRYWHTIPGKSTNFQVWNWRQRRVLWRPSQAIRRESFDFCSLGTQLILALENGAITVHSALTGTAERSIGTDLKPEFLACEPTGTRFAVAGSSGTIHIRDGRDGKLLHKMSAGTPIYRVAWHPAGRLLASGGHDGSVHLWNPRTGRRRTLLQGHSNAVVGLAFSPDGQLLMSHSWDGTTRFWDPWTGRETLRLAGAGRAFSRDGHRFIQQSGTRLQLYEVATGREHLTLPTTRDNASEDVGDGNFSNGGRWLIFGTSNGARVFDSATFTEAAFMRLPGGKHFARFHPSGKMLFTSGPTGLQRWRVRKTADKLHIGPPERLAAFPALAHFSFDRSGRFLNVSDNLGGVRLIDLNALATNAAKIKPTRIRRLRHTNVLHTATSPDGRWVAAGTHNGFGIKVWDARSGKTATVLLPKVRLSRVAFSPDGMYFAIATSSEVSLWEVDSWRLERTFTKRRSGPPATPAFSPDGRLLAFATSNAAMQLVDLKTATTIAELEGRAPVSIWRGGFSPDGATLVVVNLIGDIKLWDLRRVRSRLKAYHLDWDLPAYPPAKADVAPIPVVVDPGNIKTSQQARRTLQQAVRFLKRKLKKP